MDLSRVQEEESTQHKWVKQFAEAMVTAIALSVLLYRQTKNACFKSSMHI